MEGEVLMHQFVVGDNIDKVQEIIEQFAVDNLYRPVKRKKDFYYRKLMTDGIRYLRYNLDGDILTISYYMKTNPVPFNFLNTKIMWIDYCSYEMSLSLLFRELVKISTSSTFGEIIKQNDEYIAAGKIVPMEIRRKLLPPMPDKVEKIPVHTRRMLAVMSLILSIIGVVLYLNHIYMSGLVIAAGLTAAIIGMASKYRYISAIAYVMNMLLMAAVICGTL